MNQIISQEIAYEVVLEDSDCVTETRDEGNRDLLNFDIGSYQFEDMDLEIASHCLSTRDRAILILYLMGHTQDDIGNAYNVSRSMISKRFKVIMDKIGRYFFKR